MRPALGAAVMLTRLTAAALAALVTLIAHARTARAADEAPPRGAEEAPPRAVLLEGAAGVGAPLGYLGASVVMQPAALLAVHGGVGLATQGLQLSVGARARARMGPKSLLGFGVAWSVGELAMPEARSGDFGPIHGHKRPPIYYWRRAHTANFELSFEHDPGPLVVRPFIGLGYVLNGAEALVLNTTCRTCSPTSARFIPYFGFAVAFGVL